MPQSKKSSVDPLFSSPPSSSREAQPVTPAKKPEPPAIILPPRKESQARRYMWYGWMLILILGVGYLFFAPQADEPPVLAKTAKSNQPNNQIDLLEASSASSLALNFETEPEANQPDPTSPPVIIVEPMTTTPPTESMPTNDDDDDDNNEETLVAIATELPVATQTATETPSAEFVTHVVVSGEMPLSIAASYDIAVEDLLAANDDFNPTLLQIGQALIIPITVTPTPVPPTSTPTPKESPTPTATPHVYVVEAGDSPLSIALKHDTTSEAIMWVNKILNPSGLQVGQELVIPYGDDLSEIASSSQTALHVIRSGDTLLVLADNYGSTVADILESNPELDPTNLSLDQQIIIPLTNPRFDSTAYAPSGYSAEPVVLIPDPPAPGIVGLQQQMIMAVNAHREAHGYASYVTDESLNQIAMARAQDMDKRDYFSHVSPEGRRARDYVRDQALTFTWIGENIERNVQPEANTVNHSVTWFMGHPPHRHNILHPNYTRIGVGVSHQHHFYTFVLVFAGD
ncbi:LysM peptidoglycan-binding domain-containing protein [Anaerolineales bacterium HSG6]|nr:LysM peptidoglycan-binding domain-containing protein [Anaerolineales bacterium HSG6]